MLSLVRCSLSALPFVALMLGSACAKQHGSGVKDSVGDEAVKIATPLGEVVGRKTEFGAAFLGLPYAEPPVGARRWQAPVPVQAWSEAKDGGSISARCPQPADPLAADGIPGGYAVSGSEDCLYLNVYRPDTSAPQTALPVMVWIHGGSYLQGTGSTYDAGFFAKRYGVVVVTINYRLGALGFLAHPGLDVGSELSGNYGHQDQLEALRWVHANIAAFGGRADQVTVFGESAGGYSVCSLLVTPSAKGLMRAAIIQSGDCDGNGASRAPREKLGGRFGQVFGCANDASGGDCLREASPEALVIAGMGVGWGPVFGDGGSSILPQRPNQAFASGDWLKVPVMLGSTRDEANLFALLASYSQPEMTGDDYEQRIAASYGETSAPAILKAYPLAAYKTPRLALAAISTDRGTACGTYAFSRTLAAQGPTYAFEFNDPHAVTSLPLTSDVPELGAYHSGEITYLFQRKWLVGDPGQFTPDQQELANSMGAYWSNFAKTLDPNGAGLASWQADQKDGRYVQSLAPAALEAVPDFAAEHHCELWR